jgi:hypothetical protein
MKLKGGTSIFALTKVLELFLNLEKNLGIQRGLV